MLKSLESEERARRWFAVFIWGIDMTKSTKKDTHWRISKVVCASSAKKCSNVNEY
jgi:hypothetical protein